MNNTFFDKRVKNLVIASLAALTLFLLVEIIVTIENVSISKENVTPGNTITVSGTGEVLAIPNVATFSFTVTEDAKAVADAENMMSAKANSAIAFLKGKGIDDKDIQTDSYTTNPTYSYSSGICTATACAPSTPVLTGYEVSETVEVKVRDIKSAGDILAGISALNVGQVSGLSLTIDNPDDLNTQAKVQAIGKAEAEAKVLADSLHVHLGKVTGFYEEAPGQDSGSPVPMMAKANVVAAVAPDIQPGQQKVTSTVSITYEIR